MRCSSRNPPASCPGAFASCLCQVAGSAQFVRWYLSEILSGEASGFGPSFRRHLMHAALPSTYVGVHLRSDVNDVGAGDSRLARGQIDFARVGAMRDEPVAL